MSNYPFHEFTKSGGTLRSVHLEIPDQAMAPRNQIIPWNPSTEMEILSKLAKSDPPPQGWDVSSPPETDIAGNVPEGAEDRLDTANRDE